MEQYAEQYLDVHDKLYRHWHSHDHNRTEHRAQQDRREQHDHSHHHSTHLGLIRIMKDVRYVAEKATLLVIACLCLKTGHNINKTVVV